MTDADLTKRVLDGTATVGYRKEYRRRVEHTPNAKPCRRGHLTCALGFDGPCALDVYQPQSLPNPFADRLVALIELKVAVDGAIDAAKVAGDEDIELRLRGILGVLDATMSKVDDAIVADEDAGRLAVAS